MERIPYPFYEIGIADRLKEIMKGRSYREWAQILGVNLSTVNAWLNGQTVPKMNYLKAICKMTGTSADYILGIEGGKHGD